MITVSIPVDMGVEGITTYLFNRVREWWPQAVLTARDVCRSSGYSVMPDGIEHAVIHKDRDARTAQRLFGCRSISLQIEVEGYIVRITACGGLEADDVAGSLARLPIWADKATSRRHKALV